MITADALINAMSSVFRATQQHDGVCVTTHCLYPSGEYVRVKVYGGESSFVVSDEGRSVREVEAAGASIDRPDKAIRTVVESYGLSSQHGVIRSRHIGIDMLPIAIASVANASKESAEWLFERTKLSPTRDFKALLRGMLEVKFPANVRPGQFVGNSNKPHKFESVVSLGHRQIIVDPVVRDASAINSRVVANMDVRNANIPDLVQRIVYDDLDQGWGAEELNLLQLGATAVPYSRLHSVLPRLAQSADLTH
ncbi:MULTISPECIES: hypothetical protein [Luteimonas]|uniref:hypothetical protein n=1 Tax=Luteimonas TaxID=83614 RepID=UPI00117C7418|nr:MULTISPECIES: hypothetical protein [Luteimonas]